MVGLGDLEVLLQPECSSDSVKLKRQCPGVQNCWQIPDSSRACLSRATKASHTLMHSHIRIFFRYSNVWSNFWITQQFLASFPAIWTPLLTTKMEPAELQIAGVAVCLRLVTGTREPVGTCTALIHLPAAAHSQGPQRVAQATLPSGSKWGWWGCWGIKPECSYLKCFGSHRSGIQIFPFCLLL